LMANLTYARIPARIFSRFRKMALFEDAAGWQRRKDWGESQLEIARSVDRSPAGASRTLKCGRLPEEEKQRYAAMIDAQKITEGAVMDLACENSGDRRWVLDQAIKFRSARDEREMKQKGKRGMRSDRGKVTVDEIRTARKQFAPKG
jgi:hypothetical protein